ncbi:MAG: FliM/FliN family flagellar motor C-terminal domain-containing protein [Sphingopyxis sp.]
MTRAQKVAKGQRSNSKAQADAGGDVSVAIATAQKIPDPPDQNPLPIFCSAKPLNNNNGTHELLQSLSMAIIENVIFSFEAIAKCKMHTELVDEKYFQHYATGHCNDDGYICLNYDIKSLDIIIHLHFSKIIINKLIELYYGGDWLDNRNNEILINSSSQRAFIDKIDRIIKSIVQKTLENHYATSVGISQIQTNTSAGILSGDEEYHINNYVISHDKIFSSKVEIVIVTNEKTNSCSYIDNDISESLNQNNNDWNKKILTSAEDIKFKARAILCRLDIPVSRLIELQSGDIISINNDSLAQLIVDDQILALGHIGEKSGLSAFRIHQLEGNRHG